MGKEEFAASSLDAQFEQLEGLGDATRSKRAGSSPQSRIDTGKRHERSELS